MTQRTPFTKEQFRTVLRGLHHYLIPAMLVPKQLQ